MVRVAGVRFKAAGKVYYFDPGELELQTGDNVIVESARGVEFAEIASDIKEVEESEIVPPLKPVIRLATADDCRRHEENQKKKDRALQLCQEKIDKHKLEMKLVDVEYTFDNSKIIFYFTADGRVDFRELVKDLASVFHARIELRQIGVRDETKMMGGIGCCGRELCCHAWMPDFNMVSIKMAKTQNLSLNPIKISGICGRLMCCLQFENEVYTELKQGMPETGERIMTRDGEAVVFESNILEQRIKTRLILEEKTDEKPEKLSTEYYFYTKDEITRREKKKNMQQAERSGSRKHGKRRPKTQSEDADIAFMSEEQLKALGDEVE